MPAIYGQPMIMAGFSGESGGDEPVVNYVARLDSATQYWQLSEAINYSIGDVINITCSQPDASFPTLIGGVNTSFLVRRSNNGSILFGGCTINVNGQPAISNSTPWPDGESVFEMTLTVNVGVSRLGVRSDVLTGYFSGYMKDFSDSLGHSIPLTNKEQGAVQQPTEGSVSATMANYTPDVWEVDE